MEHKREKYERLIGPEAHPRPSDLTWAVEDTGCVRAEGLRSPAERSGCARTDRRPGRHHGRRQHLRVSGDTLRAADDGQRHLRRRWRQHHERLTYPLCGRHHEVTDYRTASESHDRGSARPGISLFASHLPRHSVDRRERRPPGRAGGHRGCDLGDNEQHTPTPAWNVLAPLPPRRAHSFVLGCEQRG